MPLSVSVVVVSRDRPQALFRCLMGLSQVQYDPFEVIVVSDKAGISGLGRFGGQIKTVLFEEANISAARNAGIIQAAGRIITFIDDDAVPEPTWLSFLCEPFEDENVAAVGGFVRGRNGISFQWKGSLVDVQGETQPIEVDEENPTVFSPSEGWAVKTEGTNMAVRRDAIVALGGFDQAYHFYLDETDLNLRMAQAGYKTAISPLAQVHHGYAASSRRRVDRVPSDLFDIGASWAVFQRKFVAQKQRETHWAKIVKLERRRLLKHMVTGGLEPSGVGRLLQRLERGYAVGKEREIKTETIDCESGSAFLPMPVPRRSGTVILARPANLKSKITEAVSRVEKDEIVTVFCFSLTALYHRMAFHADGYWLQKGGLFGKSLRGQSLFKWWTRLNRLKFENQRVDKVRNLSV